MTTQEFSNSFDTILNSYANLAQFGETVSKADLSLDEYEKSIFLTLALDLIVKLYFERTSLNLGFDESERRQVDFSSLVTVEKVKSIEYEVYVRYAPINGVLELNEDGILKFIFWLGDEESCTINDYFTNKINKRIKEISSDYGITFLFNDEEGEHYLEFFDSNSSSRLNSTSLKKLVTYEPKNIKSGIINPKNAIYNKFDLRGLLFKMPTTNEGALKILFMLNEKFNVTKDGITKSYVVKPINYREYDRLTSKAYTLPLKKQCWRLFLGDSVDIVSEIIPIGNSIKDSSVEYIIRYIRRPRPIVLTNLTEDGLDIDGCTNVTECELNPILHMDILNKAVELVLSSRGRMSQPNK